jgi:hypothetical protein
VRPTELASSVCRRNTPGELCHLLSRWFCFGLPRREAVDTRLYIMASPQIRKEITVPPFLNFLCNKEQLPSVFHFQYQHISGFSQLIIVHILQTSSHFENSI